eukprot:7379941-Prymnesium_polylepis.1
MNAGFLSHSPASAHLAHSGIWSTLVAFCGAFCCCWFAVCCFAFCCGCLCGGVSFGGARVSFGGARCCAESAVPCCSACGATSCGAGATPPDQKTATPTATITTPRAAAYPRLVPDAFLPAVACGGFATLGLGLPIAERHTAADKQETCAKTLQKHS